MIGIKIMRLLIVALQGFHISLYSVIELQRPGGEKSDWLVQCKQFKHGLISKITMFNATKFFTHTAIITTLLASFCNNHLLLALASRDPHVTHRPPNSYSSLSSFLVIYTATLTHQQVMSLMRDSFQ